MLIAVHSKTTFINAYVFYFFQLKGNSTDGSPQYKFHPYLSAMVKDSNALNSSLNTSSLQGSRGNR